MEKKERKNFQGRRVLCFSGSPKGIEFNSVKEVLLSVKAVKSMHSLHLWALTLGQALVSVHLAIGTPTLTAFQNIDIFLGIFLFPNYCCGNIFTVI